MVACSDPAYARLRVFPNLVNSKDRVYGTSLLHTAVVADQNRRRMAHFLFSCGARLGETDYTRLLERSLTADITSVSTANLPNIGSQSLLLELFRDAEEGFRTAAGAA